MPITLKNLSLAIGSTQLLDHVELSMERGERLCLVGRNGVGKSTLLRVICGEIAPDSGEVIAAKGVRIATLPQDVGGDRPGSVYEIIAQGLGEAGRIASAYRLALASESQDLDELGRLQEGMDSLGGWNLDYRIESIVGKLGLNADQAFSALSGGLKRRAILGQALVSEPDILILDEPTNHLDITSIAWLEEFLLGWPGTLLFITHDRAFLRRIATRIIELDRGHLQSWPGSYDDYLLHKAEAMHAEALADARFDKKLAQEEVWIRKGIQARRTRNEGRVTALKALREQDSARRRVPGEAKLQIQEAERSGRLVAELKNVSFDYGGRAIVKNFSTTILRGDKIGIIGANGSGKTTLLNLLLAKLTPSAGEIKLGTKLQPAYFDQLRASLDEEQPVFEAIGDGREYVEIDGVRRHVMSYLRDFLFTPDRARSPIKTLSGGERARLLLAQLFSLPANLLVLDEPTNDLDIETLDLLEELLADFKGTVLLVSHDREFIENVVTRCMVLDGSGRIDDFVGGWDSASRQMSQRAASAVEPRPTAPPRPPSAPASSAAVDNSKAAPKKKISFKEQRELESLPKLIERLEAEQADLVSRLSDADFYRSEQEVALRAQKRVSEVERELGDAYSRWEILEAGR